MNYDEDETFWQVELMIQREREKEKEKEND